MTSRTTSSLVAFACALAILSAGCGAGDRTGGEWAGSIVDSAGVSVVTNPSQGLWEATGAWTVVEDLVISDAATPGLEFGEIIDVDVDSRGRLIALDAMAKAYHVFGPDGAHLFSVGRPGNGPGEFSDPFQLLVLPGDSVVVPDVGTARASVFGPDGSFARTFAVDFLDLAARRWGVADDGTLFARRASATADVIVRLDRTGAAVDTIAYLESPYQLSEADGRVALLAPVPVWAALPGGGVAHGHSHRYRITVADATGAVRRVFTLPVSPAPFTESHRDAVRAGFREVAAKQGLPEAMVDQVLATVSFWDELPLIGELLPGPDGALLVQRAAAPRDMRFDRMNVYRTDWIRGSTWDVFDADGRYLGELRFPSRVQLFAARNGLLYGIRADELDVPSIVRYRVEMGA